MYVIEHFPLGKEFWEGAKRVKSSMLDLVVPASFYEQFGFDYYGPVDGHNLEELNSVFTAIKEVRDRPVLLHILTEKGHGIPEAAADPVKSHSGTFWIKEEKPKGAAKSKPTYSKVFAEATQELIESDERVVAITAAMLWSISHVTVKYVLMYADIFYVNTIRITVQVTIMSIILIAQNKFLKLFKINVRDIVPISLGGIFSYFFYVVFFLSSLEMIGIARATPLSRIYPLFTFILAIIFLKEKFTYVKLIGTLVIVSGVVLITI